MVRAINIQAINATIAPQPPRLNQSRRSIRRHLERHPMQFRFLWDTEGRATRALHAPSTSYVVALDAQGRVAYTGLGAEQDIERAVRKALGK